jgi:hypothetical protein
MPKAHAVGASGALVGRGRRADRATNRRRIVLDAARWVFLLSPDQRSRAAIRSATRIALAMMVRVGFTAPIEGMKLPSTT